MLTRLGPSALPLPVTGAALTIFGLYPVFLSGRTRYYSIINSRPMNQADPLAPHAHNPADPNNPSGNTTTNAAHDNQAPTAPLQRARRAFKNYVENTPLLLILSTVAELNGIDRYLLSATLAASFALRVVQVEFGIMAGSGERWGWGLEWGYYLSLPVVAGMAVWNGVVVRDWWTI